jgi:hypothetical protein
MLTTPSARAMGFVSCMRFRQRTNVLLPQPDGPISAVAWLAGHGEIDIPQRLGLAVPSVQILDPNVDSH